jgi:hypothetical protein
LIWLYVPYSVVNIPLIARADYRCTRSVFISLMSVSDEHFYYSTALEKEHWQWQFSDPASAIARKGFRPG